MVKVNEQIRNYIVDNGLKQVYVAEKAGINIRTFNNKLLGRGRITVEELEKICILGLNVSPAIFFANDVLKTKMEDGK